MLFYSILAGVALLGIVAIFVYRIKKEAGPLVAQKKVSVPSLQAVETETKPVMQSGNWQELPVAELCAAAEEALNNQNYQRAHQYLDYLLAKQQEPQVQEYIYSPKVAACEAGGDWRGAVYHCEQLLVCAPNDDQCLAKLGELHYGLSNYRTAEEYAKKALQLNNTNLEYLDLLARVYRKTMRIREAEDLKRRAVELRSRRRT